MRLPQIPSLLRAIVERGSIVSKTFQRPASCIAFACLFAAAPLAAARADEAPTIVGAVLQDTVEAYCHGDNACSLQFPPVPAGKSLIITDIACSMSFTNAAAIVPRTLQLTGRHAGTNYIIERTSYAQPFFTAVHGGQKRYQAQQKVRHLLLTGEKPLVTLALTANAPNLYLGCTLTGDLI